MWLLTSSNHIATTGKGNSGEMAGIIPRNSGTYPHSSAVKTWFDIAAVELSGYSPSSSLSHEPIEVFRWHYVLIGILQSITDFCALSWTKR
jgi:hypothetical protein